MKIRIVERKKRLNESDESSSMTISMSPADYLKLTTYGESYQLISSFILEKKHEDAAKLPTIIERKKAILGRKTLPKTMSDEQTLAVNLLLGGLNFINPASDGQKWGKYDPEKSGTTSLSVELSGNEGKIVNHEGRNRSVYLWMKDELKTNVLISFFGGTVDTIAQMPSVLIPQFESRYKVFKQNLSPAKEKDGNFRTVEGFMHFWNDKRFNKGSLGIDEFIKKFNDENHIEVAGQEAIILKAQEVNPPGSPFPLSGIYIFGLYNKDVLGLERGESNVEYFTQVAKYRFPQNAGPVKLLTK